jgi:cell division septum initiation protein DivIVA
MTTAEHTFSAARRGYDRTQVDAQLDVLSTQLRAPTSARQSALAQVEALARKLEAGIGDIQPPAPSSTLGYQSWQLQRSKQLDYHVQVASGPRRARDKHATRTRRAGRYRGHVPRGAMEFEFVGLSVAE